MKRIIINLLLILSSSALFGQTNNISLHQYCAAGYSQTWTININEAKAVKVEYQIDIFPGTDNIIFFDVNSSGGTSYSGVTPTGFSSGTYITSTQTGKIQIVLYCNTAGMKNIEIKCTADNSIVTNSNLNVGGNGYILGNLGIGIASPSEKLHVNGAIRGNSTGGALKVRTQYGFIDVGAMNGSFANIYTDMPEFAFDKPIDLISGKLTSYTNTNLYLQTGRGVDRLTILNSNGNVGIGNTTPTEKLTVNGNIHINTVNQSLNNALYVTNGLTATNAKNKGVSIVLGLTKGEYYNKISTVFEDQNPNYLQPALAFFTMNNTYIAGSEVERMRISSNGNVGIGTTEPKAKLDVAGEINMQGRIGMYINEPGQNFTYDNLTMGHYSLGWMSDQRTSSYGPALWMSSFGGIKLFTGGGQRFTINKEGKIAIGVTKPDEYLATTPIDELLSVNGTIHAMEIKIDLNTNLADYVFNSDYNLMPLPEVEKFVKENKHLPEIPSATEVQKNGLSVGEMQNKLLQKIEELTLYTIELQKSLLEQQKRIEQLEKTQK